MVTPIMCLFCLAIGVFIGNIITKPEVKVETKYKEIPVRVIDDKYDVVEVKAKYEVDCEKMRTLTAETTDKAEAAIRDILQQDIGQQVTPFLEYVEYFEPRYMRYEYYARLKVAVLK